MNVCFLVRDLSGLGGDKKKFVLDLASKFREKFWETTVATFVPLTSKKESAKIGENIFDIIEINDRFLGEKVKRESYSAYNYIKNRSFDLVLFIFCPSVGYYTSIAKRQGLLPEKIIISSLFSGLSKKPEKKSNVKNIFNYLTEKFMESHFYEKCDFFLLETEKLGSYDKKEFEGTLFKNKFDFEQLKNQKCHEFERFYAFLVARYAECLERVVPKKEEKTGPPLVSVCIVNHNRHFYLPGLLKCFEEQTYKNFEIILVDDGSTNEETLSFLDGLEETFRSRGWKIIRQENKYLGAARNEGVRHASGEYIVFADDDNYPMPLELETFVRVMEQTGADVLTSGMDIFFGEKTTERPEVGEFFGMPLGPCPSLGFFENVFGDANCCIKKSAFLKLGGFTEDYGVGYEDWEFFANAVLDGYDLQVVPENLFFYRMHQNSMSKNTSFLENRKRSIRPYLDKADPQVADILKTLNSLYNYQNYRHIFSAKKKGWYLLLKIIREEEKLGKLKYFIKTLKNEGLRRSLRVFSIYLSQ